MTVVANPKPPPSRLAAVSVLIYRINVAQAKPGVSRSTIYRLVQDGQLELVKVGKRSSRITAASLHALIERNKALAA